MSIRNKFILVLSLALVALTGAICAAVNYHLFSEEDAAFSRTASAQLDRIDDIIHIYLKGTEQAVKNLASLPEAENIALARNHSSPDPNPENTLKAEAALTQWLEILLKTLPGVEAAFCGYRNGSFHSSTTDTPPPGYDTRTQSWYSDTAWGLARTSITDIAFSRESKSLTATMAAKIMSDAGDTIGVAALVMSLGPLTDTLRDVQLGRSGRLVIFDVEGRVLFTPETQENLLRHATETNSLLRSLMELPAGQHTLSHNGTDILTASRIFPDTGWKAAILLDKAEHLATVAETFNAIALTAVLFCLVIWGIGILCITSATRPLHALIRQSKALAEGNGEALAAIAGRGPDIAALQANLGQLTGRVMLLAQAEKEHLAVIEAHADEVAAARLGVSGKSAREAYRAASRNAARSLAACNTSISEGLTGIAAQMQRLRANADTQTLSAQILLSTMAETAAGVATITHQSAETEKSAEHALTLVQKTETQLQDFSHVAESLEYAARNLFPGLDSIKAHAGDFLLATTAVRNVAEEINVLGLNLSIEISSAGESGKKFIPLAEEMRILAEKAMASAASMDNSIAVLDQTHAAHTLAANKNAAASEYVMTSCAKTDSTFTETATALRTAVEQIHVLATTVEGVALMETARPENAVTILQMMQETNSALQEFDSMIASLEISTHRLAFLTEELEAESGNDALPLSASSVEQTEHNPLD